MNYTVWYKLPNHWLWRKIKNVKDDAIAPSTNRVFLVADGTRIEIPLSAVFKFDPIRRQIELENAAKRAAQQTSNTTEPQQTTE
jgi:hypothetical protein